MERFRKGLALCAVITVVALPRAAAGDTTSEKRAAAELRYREAMELVKAGRHAEACVKFDESDRLDHTAKVRYLLADCYEHIGKIASAWSRYIDVADELKRRAQQMPEGEARTAIEEREREMRQRADAILPRVPTLTVSVPRDVRGVLGLEIKRNGDAVAEAVWDQSVPVDPGPHVVEAFAPGKEPWKKTFTIAEKAVMEVRVPVFKDTAMPGQRKVAIALGAAGVAGIVVGSVFGGLTFAQWSDAEDHCQLAEGSETRCTVTGKTFQDAKDSEAAALTSSRVSTASFLVGGAAIAGATIVWFTAPSATSSETRTGLQLVPAVGPGGFGMTIRGEL